jgi:thiamine biosynthesis protein ThiI
MMNNNEMLLLKLGEVVLKGLNRRSFEDRLTSNVRRRLKGCGSFQIYIRQSTIYVEPQNENCDMEAAYAAAQQVFGVVSVARAVPCEKTVEAIVDTAKTYLAEEFAKAKTFKVESKRADKQFRLNSIQISQEVGGDLAELFPNVAVDVHHPDLTVYVDSGEVRLRPRPCRPRRWRPTGGHGRPRRIAAVRRTG